MHFSKKANPIFKACLENYHIVDTINQPYINPYEKGSIEALLYHKNWIDTVQWHVEDLIRAPKIDPKEGMFYKRKIDQLNQERTNIVEKLDDYFLALFSNVEPKVQASINTESPAWAIDRLSILALKIYHMEEQAVREGLKLEKRLECQSKLQILKEQQKDLSQSIDELLAAIANGQKRMKVYRQMKMYNDPELNPVLYKKK